MKTAIITGASSGLGREYFKVLTEIYPDIEEFWLVARRENRLRELAESVPNAKCLILPLDLTKTEAVELYRQKLEEKKPEVEILICNAGFGKLGDAVDIPVVDQTDMVTLNCTALTAITLLTIPYMKKGSSIIEVASIAAFSPTPRMTVYSSTKAYVLSFARGLRRELKEKGINVLAVCPGPMDTEFFDVADAKGRSKLLQIMPRCSVREVAYRSVVQARKGKGVYTNKSIYKFYRILTKLLPDSVTMRKL
ncbi:MAG TPA: SDR family NAD(P)-dependent oxidoreductase [Bacillota bacterium]|nr:SDR family NAD(P)-dependent oxidoreductase [Bacillota bacterium]